MEQQLSPSVILAFVVGYFLLLLIIAWFTGRNQDNDSFFIGKRNSPWYLVAFGMIGASLSGVTFISVPGVVGNIGATNGQFSYMQMVLGNMLGYILIATVLMPLYYRLKLTSIYTYLEQRFGARTHKTGAAFFLISRCIGASFRLYLVALVLQLFVFDHWHVPFAVTVALTLLFIWIYTFKGGIRTIVFTDTLQTTFMLLAVGIGIYLIASELNLSFTGVIHTVSDSIYSKTFFWDSSQSNYFWKQFIGGAAIATAMMGLDQDMMQKNISCRNLKEAQLNMFSFSAILLVVNLVFVSLGALLYIYAQQKGISLPEKTDHVFPTLAISYFTPVAAAVFILGLIAAAYSSADSALTALTTSFCVDFLGFSKKENAGKDLVKVRYGVHIGFTVILFLLILLFNYKLKDDVVTSVFIMATYTYGPLLGMFFFGILLPKFKPDDRIIPVICVLAPIATYLINSSDAVNLGFLTLIVNGLLTFGSMFVAAMVTKATSKQL